MLLATRLWVWLRRRRFLRQGQVTPWYQAVPQILDQRTIICTNSSIFTLCNLNVETSSDSSSNSMLYFLLQRHCLESALHVGRNHVLRLADTSVCSTFSQLSQTGVCSMRRLVSLAYSFSQSCMMSLTQQGKTSDATSMVSHWSPVKSSRKTASPQPMTQMAFTAIRRA